MEEIKYIGQLKHQNIVKLIGYCYLTIDCRIHVYEFTPKGSLQSLLFRRGDDSVSLSWNRRLNIAVGVAKGLAYLDTTKANIRDHMFTSSMILIDSNYNAKLSNLELEKKYDARVPPEYKVTGNAKGEACLYNVVGLAKAYLRSEEKMLHIMDPSIEGQYSSAIATQAILLAMRCLMKDSELRPDADELVRELEQMQEW
ncbi:putative serine/threonine-protein kinase PBL11 [Bidens hawaiensis]|uniref:putative serine/threonine-protein kinase PBL11 n=1 Tax=Bidens hawaiensis TaxID=980011 RepID=UPI00404A542F